MDPALPQQYYTDTGGPAFMTTQRGSHQGIRFADMNRVTPFNEGQIMERQIIHVDISTFAVSIERLRNSGLRSRPVVVGFPHMPRSVVFATSFEARQEGIHRGMPLGQAKKICHNVIVVPPDHGIYSRATHAILKILTEFSPIIEPQGYGHAYLDMTGTTRLFGPTKDVASKVQREIHTRLRLQSTMGVAGNKLVSKIASAVIQPVSLQDVEHGTEEHFIAPLAVRYLPAFNRKVKEQLQDFNIRVIRQVAELTSSQLTAAFGKLGLKLYQASRGIDNTPVQAPQQSPNIMREQTLADDTNDLDVLRGVLRTMVEQASLQLRRDVRMTRKFTLEIFYSDYKIAFGQKKLPAAVNMDHELFPAVETLFKKILTRRTRVRKLRIRFFQLVPAVQQLSLFTSVRDGKDQRLSTAIDQIRDKFGDSAIQSAMSFKN